MTESYAAIIGVVITSAITVIVSCIAQIEGKKHFYSSTITKERISWVASMRELGAKLVSFCRANAGRKLSREELREFEYLRSSILIRISPSESKYELDNKVRELIDEKSFDEVCENAHELESVIGLIAKNEWNKSKAEAGRSRSMFAKIERDREKTERK